MNFIQLIVVLFYVIIKQSSSYHMRQLNPRNQNILNTFPMKIKQYREEINKCNEEIKIYEHTIATIVNCKRDNDFFQKKLHETYRYLKMEQCHISHKIWILKHKISYREIFQELIKSRYFGIEWEMDQFENLNKALEYLEHMDKNLLKDRYDQIFKDREGMAYSMNKIDECM